MPHVSYTPISKALRSCTPYVYIYIINIHIKDYKSIYIYEIQDLPTALIFTCVLSLPSSMNEVSATKDGKWLSPCSAGLDKMCGGPRTIRAVK
jgi:hypothetical protein